jgi:pimeloyl-ACP methyl ester carboxylesterase
MKKKTDKARGALLFIVAAVSLGCCNMQNRYLYFPSSEPPSAKSLAFENMRLWQKTATDYRGLIADREAPAPHGTFVLFHGNGGTALNRGFYLEPLGKLGFRVILVEYPKYGGRPGKVGEKPFVVDGLETVRLAYEQYGEPLYLLGESLGCGVAAAIAKQTSVPLAGLVLITPWDTLAAVAKFLFPFLPVSWFLTDQYDNIGNLQSFKGKISVVGAERDEILPVNHARHLYQSLPEGKKQMWIIKGAGHNDWPFYAEASLWKAMTDFVKVSKKSQARD